MTGSTTSPHPSPRSRVAAELAAFRGTRRRTLAMVEGLSDEQLARRPAAESWSVGEVLDHLLLAEGVYRGDIERLVELVRTGRRPFIRHTFRDLDVSVLFIPRRLLPALELPITLFTAFVPAALRDALARSRWLPVQNPTVAEPRRGRPGGELRRDLEASLATTEGLFADAGDLPWQRMAITHPLLGRNDVPALLRLMDRHEQRHQEQIRDALAATGE